MILCLLDMLNLNLTKHVNLIDKHIIFLINGNNSAIMRDSTKKCSLTKSLLTAPSLRREKPSVSKWRNFWTRKKLTVFLSLPKWELSKHVRNCSVIEKFQWLWNLYLLVLSDLAAISASPLKLRKTFSLNSVFQRQRNTKNFGIWTIFQKSNRKSVCRGSRKRTERLLTKKGLSLWSFSKKDSSLKTPNSSWSEWKRLRRKFLSIEAFSRGLQLCLIITQFNI